MTMKIGIISTLGNHCDWAGSEETWRILADHALDSGHAVSICCSERIAGSHQAEALRAKKAEFMTRKDLTGLTRRLAGKGLQSRFKRFLNQPLDVVFVSQGGIADTIWIPDLLRSLEETNIPKVAFVQANAEGLVTLEWERQALRKYYSGFKTVIFLSRHNYGLAERQMAWKFPNARIIMNPLRDPVDNPLDWPPEEVFHFAEVGRLEVADKQQDHLLEALSGEAWKDRPWNLTFYGSGDDKAHIEALIRHYGLTGKAQLGGYVSDFRDIWRNHHLHILPSRREGMPLSIIESMACGRPALVTRAGGSPEIVEDGKSGFVCPGMHPEVLREALERAWSHRADWKAFGLNAHRQIKGLLNPNWAGEITTVLTEAAK